MNKRDEGKIGGPGALEGMIFDIKRFAVHDGPGIRTTIFLKGCPLHCLWCHNPESIAPGPELIARSSRCSRCFACIPACPVKAISKDEKGGPVSVDRKKCDLCGACAEACSYEALQIVGRRAKVDDVVAEAMRDRVFYEESGGGVTLSGGEPLAQPAFAEALLTAFQERGIHTALDTSGLARWAVLDRVASKADLILYDLKLMDGIAHKDQTGSPNSLILENFIRLASLGRAIDVRIPLVSGVNDGQAAIRAQIDFLRALPAVRRIDLLAYHKGGQEKYRNLGKQDCFRIFEAPSAERMEAVRRDFADAGFTVSIGG